MPQKAKKVSIEIKKTMELKYLENLPNDYSGKNPKKYPLVIFLHGAGERGIDLNKIKKHGIPMLIEKQSKILQKYEFISVSPQCPEEYNWNYLGETLEIFLKDYIKKTNVDTKRIYLTGLSMGGYGSWNLAFRNPNVFAAVAPICGSAGNGKNYSSIKHIPIWVFHGAKDTIVPLSESTEPVAKLNDLEANIKFTVYPDLEHDSWTKTYENPNFYKWLFSQKNENFKL